jgi:hypothetical protein
LTADRRARMKTRKPGWRSRKLSKHRQCPRCATYQRPPESESLALLASRT